MNKLVECVPNFSEGRNQEIIDAISNSIRNTPGCTLLDVDPGKSTNRTVYTFVGTPEAVVEGAINSAKTAYKLIDMTKHTGEHPRMGAMDVCPFVPVANVTMEECVECSKQFGKRISEELGIPIYLYEEAQPIEYRKKLPSIREGEYEAIPNRITKDEWKPDYGPAKFVPNWGATVTGARFFLIAYNVNVLGTKEQAHRIALNIREAGRSEKEPGRLKETKAIGWYVEEYKMSQISINLTNYLVTSPHIAYEECAKDAKELNIAVAGSELVGLIPLEAMIMAAEHFMAKENLFIVGDEQKIKLVIDRLGLNSVSQFVPEKRIIEYLIQDKNNEPLASLSLRGFIESIAARTSAPGGGSASAAIAAFGSGLGCMVAQLTYGVRKFESVDSDMREVIPTLFETVNKLIPMIDADTNAFNDYVEAMRLPKNSPEEISNRNLAMQNGLKKAIEIPLGTMKIGVNCWDSFIHLAKTGNIASKSDMEVGAKSLHTGIWGAYKNVLINMADITDEDYKATTIKFAHQMVNESEIKMNQVLEELDKRDKNLENFKKYF
jgi:glutamate formiminotransferase/formiminotetrahydrofolate cyclodeaminase